MLKIIVKDDGIGISENAQQLLFNTFYRDQEVVNIEGTGVGLTIVKESVELLKGTINIKSEKGHGSTFTVSIPLGTEL
jgi:signal transduction histidine kinase